MSRLQASKLTTQGRRFAARITQAEEQTKTWQKPETGEDVDVTQLALRFERPDSKYELEWYRFPEGDQPISSRSDLGKLINYFAKMKVPDIGENDYEPITNLYVWVQVFPRENRRTGEPSDKRFPVALMSSEDIAKEFGSGAVAQKQTDPTPIFSQVLDDLLPAIDGLPQKALLSKMASIQSIADHPQADLLFEATTKGTLRDWLVSEGHGSVDEQNVIIVTSNGPAPQAAPEAEAEAEETPANA